MILALDFDGTVTTHRYPGIGERVPYCLEVLERVSMYGHQIVLWTCRNGEELDEAATYCKSNGIVLSGVNRIPSVPNKSGKIFADIYIDDRGLGTPLIDFNGEKVVDWITVERMLCDLGWIP